MCKQAIQYQNQTKMQTHQNSNVWLCITINRQRKRSIQTLSYSYLEPETDKEAAFQCQNMPEKQKHQHYYFFQINAKNRQKSSHCRGPWTVGPIDIRCWRSSSLANWINILVISGGIDPTFHKAPATILWGICNLVHITCRSTYLCLFFLPNFFTWCFSQLDNNQ